MRDANYEIKKSYFKLLNGKISFKGQNVALYDTIVPDQATKPYILYSGANVRGVSSPNQTNYQFTVAVLLDVVTEYLGNFGGSSDCDLITDAVKRIVMPGRPFDPKPLNLLPVFKVIVTTHLSDTPMTNLNDTTRIVRNLIRFQHIIEQI